MELLVQIFVSKQSRLLAARAIRHRPASQSHDCPAPRRNLNMTQTAAAALAVAVADVAVAVVGGECGGCK